MTLRLAETFHSLQGEGPSAGTPAHFLRLQGCDVGCRWCDTKYSWDADGGSGLPADRIWAAALGLGEALRIGDELRRQALLQSPGWPDAADRAEDLLLVRHRCRIAPRFI